MRPVWAEERCVQVLWGSLREIDGLEDPGIDRSIILKLIFRKWDGGHGMD
jgi:hypothetical protein